MNNKIDRKTSLKYLLSLALGLPLVLGAEKPTPKTLVKDNQWEQFGIPVDLFFNTENGFYDDIALSAILDMLLHQETLSLADNSAHLLIRAANRGLKEGYLKVVNRQIISCDYNEFMPMETEES